MYVCVCIYIYIGRLWFMTYQLLKVIKDHIHFYANSLFYLKQ